MILFGIWIFVGLSYLSLIPLIFYTLNYIENRYKLTLVFGVLAYVIRVLFRVLSSQVVGVENYLMRIGSTLCIFITLMALSIFVLNLYDQTALKKGLFYTYSLGVFLLILVVPDTLFRAFIILGLSIPYLIIYAQMFGIKQEQVWILVKLGRFLLFGATMLLVILDGFLNGFLELSEILYNHDDKNSTNFCQQCGYPCGPNILCSYCLLINEFRD